MEQQPQLVLLQKTMAVSEGVGRVLNPNVNIWQLAQPLVEGWIRANLGPEARARQMAGDGLEMLQRVLPVVVARVGAADARPGGRPGPTASTGSGATGGSGSWPLAAGLALGLALAAAFG